VIFDSVRAPSDSHTLREAPMTSRYAFWLLAIPGLALALFRSFGVLFFAASNSLWLLVPALVLVLLILITIEDESVSPLVLVAILVAYLLSYVFAGWDRLLMNISNGTGPSLDILELVIISLLLARWWAQYSAAKNSYSDA
jgi:hypothetical protein